MDIRKGLAVSRCFFQPGTFDRLSLVAHHLDGRVHEAEIRLFLIRKGDHDRSHCGKRGGDFPIRGSVQPG